MLRRILARNFGQISSFKLVSKPSFDTNIAFVAFSEGKHARLAFEGAPLLPELSGIKVEYFKAKKKKEKPSSMKEDIKRLGQLDLLGSPPNKAVDSSSVKLNLHEMIKANLDLCDVLPESVSIVADNLQEYAVLCGCQSPKAKLLAQLMLKNGVNALKQIVN